MRKNENGRSMIEMLGVLAIIGVLSVGGIYGYTSAMIKYKANEVAQTASMYATAAHSSNGGLGGHMTDITKAGLKTNPGGVVLTAYNATCTNSSGVKITTPSESGCPLVAIEFNSADTNWDKIKKAVCNIAPRKAGDESSTAGRAGYFICGCSEDTTTDTACPSTTSTT